MQNNKIMMIIIIAMLVILVVAIGGFTFYFMTSMKNKEGDQVPNILELKQEEITEYDIGTINTNLLTSADGSEHMIRVSFVLGVNNSEKKKSEELLALIETKDKLVQSIALSVVKNKTLQEMRRPDAENILADEVLARLQEEFNTNLFVRVSVYDILMN